MRIKADVANASGFMDLHSELRGLETPLCGSSMRELDWQRVLDLILRSIAKRCVSKDETIAK